MGNWVEKNATRSIIVYSITLVAATCAVMYFILFENRSMFLKTEKENLKSQIQTLNERISILQYDNANYIDQNIKLKEWLKLNPTTFEFLEVKIKVLEEKLSQTDTLKSRLIENKESITYLESDLISIGQAYTNLDIGVSIGLNNIKSNRTASGVINLPNKNKNVFSDVQAGDQWNFEYNDTKYSLILIELNYIADKYKVAIRKK